MSPPRVAVVGLGAFGQAIARLLQLGGAELSLWARRGDLALPADLASAHRRADLAEACRDAEIVVLAIPASALRSVARRYGDVARPDQVVLHAIRGAEPGFRLPHEVLREETCVRHVGVLGGPLHAPDLAQRRPIAAVLASRFELVHDAITPLARKTPVRLYRSHDLVGVEVAGTIANVTALAVGMAEHLELGDTARGILLTRGLAEAAALGRALGAETATFTGLAGVGELIPRRVVTTERHHQAGARLAAGDGLEAALAAVSGEVEGTVSAAAAAERAGLLGVRLPLVQGVAAVCRGDLDARSALEDVLAEPLEL